MNALWEETKTHYCQNGFVLSPCPVFDRVYTTPDRVYVYVKHLVSLQMSHSHPMFFVLIQSTDETSISLIWETLCYSISIIRY